jgi:hypothetical protein
VAAVIRKGEHDANFCKLGPGLLGVQTAQYKTYTVKMGTDPKKGSVTYNEVPKLRQLSGKAFCHSNSNCVRIAVMNSFPT